jgi:hypothetical protein
VDQPKRPSFAIKMWVTELREYLIEANDVEEATLRAESGQVCKDDYAHCHTLDWEVCELTVVADQD